MRTIGFLHTAPVHVATFEGLLTVSGADVRAVHVVDEPLLADARVGGLKTLRSRLAARLAEVAGQGADVVCCTCSTLGGAAEQLGVSGDGASDHDVPVVRVDRPMARRAVELGERVVVVAALASTVEPSREVLLDEASRAERPMQVNDHVVEGAWDAFLAGDLEGYERQVAEACRTLAVNADVIVLAQASMAGVVDRLADLGLPVLASPGLAVDFLIGLVS